MPKITFIGDIMCEKPLQNYYLKHSKEAFADLFRSASPLWRDSDFVVGNLETVFGGEAAGYTKELYNFNTPDALAKSLKEGGVDLVTTATNHALDRGIAGLIRTAEVLEGVGVSYTGTSKDPNKRSPVFFQTLGGVRVAFISYTYGTNTHETKLILTHNERKHLNLLKPQSYRTQTVVGAPIRRSLPRRVLGRVARCIPTEVRMRLLKKLGRPYNVPRVDHLAPHESEEFFLEDLNKDLEDARRGADYVVACLHMGGQFNDAPGTFSQFVTDYLREAGVDLMIGTHPHVVQRYERKGRTDLFYCLGNFSISPSSIYLLPEFKPEYSIAVHLYLTDQGKKSKITFSILKLLENEQGGLRVVPLDELIRSADAQEEQALRADARFIAERVLGPLPAEQLIQREYEIP
ncbi:hypothetical protein ABB02_00833 [Clostridiaceae bacterium JG1575]|nr:hypothetical protein ABB02_00833 [Clostridiaceae bacterium JG1575]